MKITTKRVLAVALSGVLCGTMLLSQGCKEPEGEPKTAETPAASGGGDQKVGVVNLGNISKDLGWSDRATAKIEELKEQEKEEGTKIENAMVAGIKKQLQDYGLTTDAKQADFDKLDPEKKQKVAQLQAQLQQFDRQFQMMANQQIQQYAAKWDQQYMAALKPVIRDVAASQKVSVVLNETMPVVWASTAVDLSGAVEDAAHKSGAQKPEDVPLPEHLFKITENPATQPATMPK